MKRASNFELLRIVAMLLVLLLHSNYFSLGGVDFTNNGNSFFPSFVKTFSEQLCVICINVNGY